MQIRSFTDMFLSQDSIAPPNKQKSSLSLEFLDETFQSSKTADRRNSQRKGTLPQNIVSSFGAFYEAPAKIIVVGDASVGKSCLITRFIHNEFNDSTTTTIGIAHKTKKILLKNTTSPSLFDLSCSDQSTTFSTMNLNIWDTAGSERFRSLSHLFFNGAKGVIFVMDLTQRKTFLNLKYWMEQVKNNLDENVVKCLFCNKCDMENREVTTQEIAALCEMWNINFFEGSAKNGNYVENAFHYVAEEIHENITNSLNKIVSSGLTDPLDMTNSKNLKYGTPLIKEALLKLDSKEEETAQQNNCKC